MLSSRWSLYDSRRALAFGVARGLTRAPPAPADEGPAGGSPADYPVVRVPSLPMPGYGRFRLGLPSPAIRSALTSHRTELVHLASPFFLGARGSAVAQHLGVPQVAVYQTDVPGYARAYHTGRLGEAAAWR